MTNLQQYLRRNAWIVLLALSTMFLLSPSFARAQETSLQQCAAVDNYQDDGIDGDVAVDIEQTVCIYYDPQNGIDGYEEVDNNSYSSFYGEYGTDNLWMYAVGADAQIYDGSQTVLVTDSGIAYGPSSDSSDTSAVARTSYVQQQYGAYYIDGILDICEEWPGADPSGCAQDLPQNFWDYNDLWVPLQVSAVPSGTFTLTTSGTPSTPGQPIILTASVASGNTGYVGFYVDGIYDGTVKINGTTATDTIGANEINSGPHTVSAQWYGDANYAPITSTITQVVSPSPLSLTTSAPNNPITLTATISPAGATGTVTFFIDGWEYGSATISGNTATLTPGLLNAATYTFTASYSGDSNYSAAWSNPLTQNIALAPTPITVSCSPNTVPYGGTNFLETCTATVGGTGGVSYWYNGNTYPNYTYLNSGDLTNGSSTVTNYLQPLSPGTYSVMVNYNSDGVHNAATAFTTITFQKATPILSLTSSVTPSATGQPVTFTATITGGATGVVTFLVDGASIGTATISDAIATLTTSALTAGAHTLAVLYSGDSNYNTATSTAISQVVGTSPIVDSVTPSRVPPGGFVTIRGYNFGASQGTSLVTVNGSAAIATSWSNTNITATLSGSTPNGNDQVSVKVGGTTSNALPLAVPPAPVITPSSLPNGSIGKLYSAQLSANGGTPPYTWSIVVGSLPPGLSLYNGEISGTPTTSGSYTFLVSVSDSSSPALMTSEQYAITINQMVLPAYGYINTVAGTGESGIGGNGELATSVNLDDMSQVAVDAAGNIYFNCNGHNTIRKVTAATGIITTVAGNGYVVGGYALGGQGGYSGDGGPATSAELNTPQDVALDASGNLYIADSMNNVIRKVTASTGIITTVAGNGYGASGICCSGGYSGDGGPATSAELYTPIGVSLDGYGNIYIADYLNNRVRKVTVSTGIITTVAGNGTAGFNGDNQLATSAELNGPAGVAVDSYGDIYIADFYSNRIREVTPSTGFITTVAGDGAAGYTGDGGPAVLSELYVPTGVAVDANGNIYIADTFNQRIRKVTSGTDGTITTVAGNGTIGFNGDNQLATSAELYNSSGVAVDTSGNIYISDNGNLRIRVVGGELTPTTFNPLYKVTSILYSPPGNQSSQGYGTTTTNGTTTTVGSSFTSGSVGTYSSGIPGILSVSGSIGYSQTTSTSDAFTETYTNATTLTTDGNSNSSFNQKGLDGQTLSDALNHHLDTFEIWLNPLVTVESNGTTPVSYAVSSQPITINGEPAPISIVLGVPAIVMEAAPAGVTTLNPTGAAGVSTVPLKWLVPQAFSQTGLPNAYGPGLGAICTNNLLYQQQLAEDLANPTNPAQICTQGNQCGCTPSDFAAILETNPLLNYNSTTHTASPYNGTVSPLELDSLPTTSGPGSGPVKCGLNAVPSGSNCRYVAVPYTGTNTAQTASQNAVPQYEPLSGTQYPGFTLTDTSTTAETLGGSTSDSTSVSVGGGPLVANLKVQDTWTWTESESVGNTYGSANSRAVTLKTSTASCNENVSIFEDTVYHSFVFQIPTGNLGCN